MRSSAASFRGSSWRRPAWVEIAGFMDDETLRFPQARRRCREQIGCNGTLDDKSVGARFHCGGFGVRVLENTESDHLHLRELTSDAANQAQRISTPKRKIDHGQGNLELTRTSNNEASSPTPRSPQTPSLGGLVHLPPDQDAGPPEAHSRSLSWASLHFGSPPAAPTSLIEPRTRNALA